MQIISRTEAKSLGLKRYFTGKPCKNGHIDVRIVANKNCRACALQQARIKGYKQSIETRREAAKRYQLKNYKNKGWAGHIKRTFGVSAEQFTQMLVEQNNKCAICGIDANGVSNRFSVDHNHATGKIRSLLCNNCNAGLGLFKENPETFESAIRYLKRHEQNV